MNTLLQNRYRIIERLGSGGFGETFLAQDTQMPSQRHCVIKQLKPIRNNPEIYQLIKSRFFKEAEILENLGEENRYIPRLYANFEENDQFYLVQEWIEGRTLRDKVEKEGALTEKQTTDILTHILLILESVHNQRIIHRDIKPDNIILRNSDNKPVLIDFGAVKETMGTEMSPSGHSSRSIIIGTPGFMPSEQGIGRPVFSSDLYSLGLTAIYLLIGKFPQELNTDPVTGEIIWQPDIPNINPQLASVINKAIQSHSRDRYISAKEMSEALSTGIYSTSSLPTIPVISPSENNSKSISAKTQNEQKTIQEVSWQPMDTQLQDRQKTLIISSIIIGISLIGGLGLLGLILSKQPQPTVSLSPSPSSSIESSPYIPPTPSPSPSIEPSPSIPSLSNLSKPSPKDAVSSYYNAINSGQYLLAWDMLNPELQQDKKVHPNGYLSFENWFQQITPIEIQSINLIQELTDSAIVDVDYQFRLNGQTIDMSLRFNLVWNPQTETWNVSSVKKLK